MYRKAFIMSVYPEQQEEYEKRHENIWPEMVKELHNHGVSNYSIFLDKETSKLFGYIEIEEEELWKTMSLTEINQKWWAYMAPVMVTNEDNSPVATELEEVFHLD